MDELISRQAAIKIVQNRCKRLTTGCVLAVSEIEQLPPIQPVNNSEVPNSSDCISRRAAINAIDECYCGGEDSCGEPWIYKENAVEAIQMIERLPSAEPKIIRCKDCKHWIPYDWMFSEAWQSKNIADYPEDEIDCEWSEMSMKANDFCSRGEKREVTT